MDEMPFNGVPPDVRPRAAPVETLPEAKQLTRARARDLRVLIGKYVRRHLPERPKPQPSPEAPPRFTGSYARLLPLLQAIPWALGLLFVLSFAVDVAGWSFVFLGEVHAVGGLLRTLAVSGLIGFLTNWLAITMLFHPRRKRPVFGQGLIPAQRERVIYRLAKAVSEELINEAIIKEKIEESQIIPRYRELSLSVARGVLEDEEFRQDLKGITADYAQTVLSSEPVRRKMAEFLVEKVEAQAGEGLGGVALRAYRYFGEDDFQRRIQQAVDELPSAVEHGLDEMDHLLDRVPPMLEARAEDIEAWVTRTVLGFVEQFDVYAMIVENMRRYDEQQLERLLKNTANEQLNYIKYLGGVLGFFGGLVIWQPILALLAFAALGLALYLVDQALLRRAAAG